MITEKYLRIDPSGDLSWISIDRVPYEWVPGYEGISLDQIYAAIDCSCVVPVHTIINRVIMIVDESGNVKRPVKPHNELASRLYAGWLYGIDNIVGSVILCEFRPTEPYGEMDLFPLSPANLARVSLSLGVRLPEI